MRAFEVTFNYPVKGFLGPANSAAPRFIQGGTTEKRVLLAETIVEVVASAEEWIDDKIGFIQNIRDLGLAYNCE